MSFLHDMFFQPTRGEVQLREDLAKTKEHAEKLEDALLIPDPEEFSNPKRHVEICFERQRAAHAWRWAGALQSELNGAENRRYSRSNFIWMIVGFGGIFLKTGITIPDLSAVLKILAGL